MATTPTPTPTPTTTPTYQTLPLNVTVGSMTMTPATIRGVFNRIGAYIGMYYLNQKYLNQLAQGVTAANTRLAAVVGYDLAQTVTQPLTNAYLTNKSGGTTLQNVTQRTVDADLLAFATSYGQTFTKGSQVLLWMAGLMTQLGMTLDGPTVNGGRSNFSFYVYFQNVYGFITFPPFVVDPTKRAFKYTAADLSVRAIGDDLVLLGPTYTITRAPTAA